MVQKINSQREVTQKDVAKRAGVSPSVVSYVINNGPRPVSGEARERVLKAIDELAYKPNRFAQQLMRNKWQSQDRTQFAVVLGGGPDNLQRPFYSSVLTGIFKEARQHNRRVLSIQFLTDLKDPLLFNTLVESRDIFGIILLALDPFQLQPDEIEVLERIVDRFDNVISAERDWRDLPAVTFDLEAAATNVTNHLLSLGHKKIAYIGTQDARLDGYCKAIKVAGLPAENRLEIISPQNLNTYEFGFQSAETVCNTRPDITAIFAASDEVAIGVMGYLQTHGYQVPDQIALMGIDNVEQSAFTSPALSTVQIPKIELGQEAVKLLIEHGKEAAPSQHGMKLSTRLVIRESCGANASKSE